VIKDVEEDLISQETAARIYHIVFNSTNMVLDRSTLPSRTAERAHARSAGPVQGILQAMGQGGTAGRIRCTAAGAMTAAPSTRAPSAEYREKTMKAESMEAVFMPNPKDVKIAELQARVLPSSSSGIDPERCYSSQYGARRRNLTLDVPIRSGTYDDTS